MRKESEIRDLKALIEDKSEELERRKSKMQISDCKYKQKKEHLECVYDALIWCLGLIDSIKTHL